MRCPWCGLYCDNLSPLSVWLEDVGLKKTWYHKKCAELAIEEKKKEQEAQEVKKPHCIYCGGEMGKNEIRCLRCHP